MALRTLSAASLMVALSWMTAAAQDAKAVVAAAAKAMGTETLNSITYSGTARNGAFGQSKSIGNPMGPVNLTQITQYTRTINFEKGEPTALVSRATGHRPTNARERFRQRSDPLPRCRIDMPDATLETIVFITARRHDE